jgi:hypothetical protein
MSADQGYCIDALVRMLRRVCPLIGITITRITTRGSISDLEVLFS